MNTNDASPRRLSFRGLWERWDTGVWKRGDFRKLWAAQTVSEFGTLISRTAIPFAAILELKASPLQISALGACSMAPAFAVGLFAGAWVDRLPRKPIMIAADLGRAVLLLLVPIFALFDMLSMSLLYVVSAAVSVLTVFFDVAYRSILPSILPPEEMLDGNARLSASASVAEAGSFSLGGWLVQLFTAPGAVLVDSVSFIWSAIWLRRITIVERVKTVEEREPIVSEVRDGLKLVWHHRALRSLAFYSCTFEIAFNLYGAVFLIFVAERLGFSPGVLGVTFALGGLSSVMGAALAGRVTSALGLFGTVTLMTVLMAIGQGAVVAATTASLFALGLLVAQQFLVDAPYTIVDINMSTIRQLAASEEWQGRINATFRVLGFGGALLGTIAGGVIGEYVGLRAAMLTSAGIMLVGLIWARGIGSAKSEPEIATTGYP
ncbi:MFS transporter [soil metagenome]